LRRLDILRTRKFLELASQDEVCSREMPHVLLLDRKGSRKLIDESSRQPLFPVLQALLVSQSLTIELTHFEDFGPKQQAQAVGLANFLLGAHGAALTNAIFFAEVQKQWSSTLVEISLRFVWCNFVHEGSKGSCTTVKLC